MKKIYITIHKKLYKWNPKLQKFYAGMLFSSLHNLFMQLILAIESFLHMVIQASRLLLCYCSAFQWGIRPVVSESNGADTQLQQTLVWKWHISFLSNLKWRYESYDSTWIHWGLRNVGPGGQLIPINNYTLWRGNNKFLLDSQLSLQHLDHQFHLMELRTITQKANFPIFHC